MYTGLCVRVYICGVYLYVYTGLCVRIYIFGVYLCVYTGLCACIYICGVYLCTYTGLCVCIYIYSVYFCLYTGLCVWTHACRALKLTLGFFLNCSLLYWQRQGLSMNLESPITSSLASQLATRIHCLCLSGAGLQNAAMPAWLSQGSGDLNSSPHACKASTLSTESCLAPFIL